MIAAVALPFLLGIALEQFYKAVALLPATIVVFVGVLMLELLAGHSAAPTLVSVLVPASALQVGFLLGSLFSGLLAGASRSASTAAPRPK
jgi:hypothetical protein